MRSCVTAIIAFVSVAAVAAELGACQDGACDADSVVLLQAQGVADNVIQGETQAEAEDLKKPKAASAAAPAAAKSSVNFKAAIAEYLAMTLFVIIGCGSAMGVANSPGWVFQVALTFGVAISVLVWAIGHYSGGHINSAVTLALVVTGHCTVMQGFLNFLAQLFGAITGALVLTIIYPEKDDKTGGLGCNDTKGATLRCLVAEVTGTFLLVFVIFETAVNPAAKAKNVAAPLAIGLAVFLAHTVMIPIDGCSINPTRSLGPALVRRWFYKEEGKTEEDKASLKDMWVFFVGPFTGAVAAAFLSTMMAK